MAISEWAAKSISKAMNKTRNILGVPKEVPVDMSSQVNTPVLRNAIQEEMKKNVDMAALGVPQAPQIDQNLNNLQRNNVGGWQQMVADNQPPNLQQEIANYVSNLPPVQPTRTEEIVDKVKGFTSEALERGGQFGGQALNLGGQALGGLLDLAKNPETWKIAADLGALTNASANPELAAQLARISGSIGDRIEASNKTISNKDRALTGKYLADEQLALAQAKALTDNPTEGYNFISKEKYDRLKNNPSYGYSLKTKKVNGETKYEQSTTGATKLADNFVPQRNKVIKGHREAKLINDKVDLILNSNFEEVLGTFEIGGLINVSKERARKYTGTLSAENRSILGAIDSLRNQNTIKTLIDMRSDKTGATGFGQLNEKEFEALKNAIVSLRTDQTPEQFIANINTIKDISNLAKARSRQHFIDLYGDGKYQSIIFDEKDLPTGSEDEVKTTPIEEVQTETTEINTEIKKRDPLGIRG